ncbi:MAG: hypothetical protein ACYDEY_05040 [Acidimicrobiales bacterium]
MGPYIHPRIQLESHDTAVSSAWAGSGAMAVEAADEESLFETLAATPERLSEE